MATPLNDVAAAHLAADYRVRVVRRYGALVGEVLRDDSVVWSSPLTARQERVEELAREHIGALCGLRDVLRQ